MECGVRDSGEGRGWDGEKSVDGVVHAGLMRGR